MGHYCICCDRERANEKFSGKGHSRNICKECMRAGRKPSENNKSEMDRELNKFRNSIKDCCILSSDEIFCLFTFNGSVFVIKNNEYGVIYQYQSHSNPFLYVDNELSRNDVFREALMIKFEGCQQYDGYMVINNEVSISKKHKKYLEIFTLIESLE
jgi:hypothetical protein